MSTAGEKARVCVTGAGGFVASWLVKLLLSDDFIVHGTLRQAGDSRHAHLNKLENASENLKLFEADLLDYNSLSLAISGCTGVFHVACPVLAPGDIKNPLVDVIEPAVKGTLNVLNACLEAKVKRVIVVSSVAAVLMNPSWPKGQVKDETCWSDADYVKTTERWYFLAKTLAESEAVEFGRRSGLDIVTVCPAFVLGPMLQSTMNTTSGLLVGLLKGGFDAEKYNHWTVVDVRDVAQALVLTYKKPEAQGRYICTAHAIWTDDLVNKLSSVYPDYHYPGNVRRREEVEEKLSSEKLEKLGWSYRPVEETLVDSVESLRNSGILD